MYRPKIYYSAIVPVDKVDSMINYRSIWYCRYVRSSKERDINMINFESILINFRYTITYTEGKKGKMNKDKTFFIL